MNSIEIKEKRLLLGISQKELAKRTGVSTQTINGYENGKEIPTTKYQILDTILNQNTSNIIKEPSIVYGVTIKETNEKIIQALEKLEEVDKIIELATISKDENLVNHYTHIAKLLKEQIKLIRKSNVEIKEDLDILKKL